MGYCTTFDSEFSVSPAVPMALAALINAHSVTHQGKTMPSSYCGWVISEDGQAIEHDGGEKFYGYVDWLKFIIDTHLKPNGHVVNGKVRWQGEEGDDSGVILVVNNEVKHAKDIRTNPLD